MKSPINSIGLFMKTACHSLAVGAFALVIAVAGCSKPQSHLFTSLKNPETGRQLKQFVAEKRLEISTVTNEAAPGFEPFFADAANGNWLAVSNDFEELRKHAGQYGGSSQPDPRLRGPRWEAVKEIWGAFAAFAAGEKYAAAFGNDIIQSIPPGSVYFGGTDPGRFLVTAMEKSQVDADPFFTITQNALADGTYVEYLRTIYGDKLYIPTADDLQRCFQEYSEDAQRRLQSHQLLPGEKVDVDASGHVQVSGQVAVMAINARLVRVIFDQNTNHEFYIEESFPLDWMYPYLEPHGLIMKINREPQNVLSAEAVRADHDYWAKYTKPMIGDWLNANTPVADVAAFAEKIHGKHDLSGFTGDAEFIRDDYAQKSFSKLRSSIAGIYEWRLGIAPSGAPVPPEYQAKTDEEKQAMSEEADFAFKQAFALCPASPEAVFRYVAFLKSQNRRADALLVAQTAWHVDPHNMQYMQVVNSLSR